MNVKLIRLLAIVSSALAIVLAALSLFVWRYLLFAAFGCVIVSTIFNLLLLKKQRAIMNAAAKADDAAQTADESAGQSESREAGDE